MKFQLPVVSRRELIAWLGAVSVGCTTGTTPIGYFTARERSALGALANAVLPPDDTPGGADLGAVTYIERLLTALDTNMVFAGGPYSGRQPFADGTKPAAEFSSFLELDRVARKSWEGRIADLRKQMKEGMESALAAAPGPIEKLTQAEIVDWFRGLPMAFRDLMVDLVSQAAFAAPEYGGNVGLGGWKLAHYEGDSQPLGYSIWDDAKMAYRERPEAPMSGPNPSDPEPMDDEVRGVIRKIVAALGGKELP